jgi:predicted DsbA family dithiol-disulfide isomerase
MELGQEAFERYNQEVYTAYWEQQEDISKPEVLRAIAERVGLDGEALTQSVVAKRYEENIIPFDEEAHALGIRNVPTFIFMTSERLAEANYTDLARATERFLIRSERYRGK